MTATTPLLATLIPALIPAQKVPASGLPERTPGASRRAVGAAADSAGRRIPRRWRRDGQPHRRRIRGRPARPAHRGNPGRAAASPRHRNGVRRTGSPPGRTTSTRPPFPSRRPTHRRFTTWVRCRDHRPPMTPVPVLEPVTRRARPVLHRISATRPRDRPATGQTSPRSDARRPSDRRDDGRAGAGPDRRRMAVDDRQEQPAEQHRSAGPQFARHPRRERPVRRRELPDRGRRQPLGAEQRHGRGQHRRRRGRPLGHRHAGQHPGQP